MPHKLVKKTRTTSKFVPHIRVIVTTIALVLIGGGASVYAYTVYQASLTAAPDTVVVAPSAVDKEAASTTIPHTTTTTTTVPSTAVIPVSSSQVPSLSSTSSSQSNIASYQSNNWAGYLSTGSNFTTVSGTWVASNPSATSTTTESGDGTWIGIGGVTTQDLIQIGTENTISPSGVLTTAGFYELIPDGAHATPSVSIQPGDTISASITETAANVWTLSLTNVSSGQSFSVSVNYSSTFSSAEWIQEDPAYPDGSLVPLDNFGTVSFTNASTTMEGTNFSAAASGAAPITMNGGGKAVATPSSLTSDSFIVQRQ